MRRDVVREVWAERRVGGAMLWGGRAGWRCAGAHSVSQAFDVQGSSRLAGEKAFNPDIEEQFTQKTRIQLQEFLGRKDQRESAEFDKICKICRLNAEDVLNRIG